MVGSYYGIAHYQMGALLGMKAFAAAVLEKLPAGHVWHVSLSAALRNVPGVQGSQKSLPALGTW